VVGGDWRQCWEGEEEGGEEGGGSNSCPSVPQLEGLLIIRNLRSLTKYRNLATKFSSRSLRRNATACVPAFRVSSFRRHLYCK
jgi:hypothetical protein